MTILFLLQARTGSGRLPGKVLLPLGERTLLEAMVERVRSAQTPARTIVATTHLQEDDPIVGVCERAGIDCFRGHPTDLLDRHVRAGRAWNADVLVKIPSDCPLIDPAVIDRVLRFFLQNHGAYDYVSNLHPATYPDGNDVEVMTMEAAEIAWREAERPFEREHTTPFLWDQPDRFRIGNVAWETGLDYSRSHRWTIDYPEDYALIRAIYETLHTPGGSVFTLAAIIRFLDEHPDIAVLNARYAGVNWYRHHLTELRTISPTETRNP